MENQESEKLDISKFSDELESCSLYADSLKEKAEAYISNRQIPLNDRWEFFCSYIPALFKNAVFYESDLGAENISLTIQGTNAFRYEGYGNGDNVDMISWVFTAESQISRFHSGIENDTYMKNYYSDRSYITDPSVIPRIKEVILKANSNFMAVSYIEEGADDE